MRTTITLLLLSAVLNINCQIDTLTVFYLNQTPYAYSENNVVQGIEAELISEYVSWLKIKKQKNYALKFVARTNVDELYAAVKKTGNNSFGLGKMPITTYGPYDIDFSTPYLKHITYCVTNGNAPDVKTKNANDVIRTLGSMSALTVSNTAISNDVKEIKKEYLKDVKVSYLTDEKRILDEISKNVLYFGYVDAATFWLYLKNNPQRSIKMQKILSKSNDDLGFLLAKNSQHKATFAEFFAGPNGFKNSATYRMILERYLGSFLSKSLALN